MGKANREKSQAEIEAWLISQVAERLGIDPRRVNAQHPLARYGLDSIVAIELTEAAEQWLGHPVSETVMWDEPNIEAIARQLASEPETLEELALPLAPTMPPATGEAKSTSAEPVAHLQADSRSTTQPLAPPAHLREDPIAIIGLSCRFPGAANAEEFWELLTAGRDAISEVPPDRWDSQRLYDANPEATGKMITR